MPALGAGAVRIHGALIALHDIFVKSVFEKSRLPEFVRKAAERLSHCRRTEVQDRLRKQQRVIAELRVLGHNAARLLRR